MKKKYARCLRSCAGTTATQNALGQPLHAEDQSAIESIGTKHLFRPVMRQCPLRQKI